MNPISRLTKLGQSVWLDNITRTLLDDGTLARYVAVDGITGLTSNPSIFDAAIGSGSAYDAEVRHQARAGLRGEELFIELALSDLRRAADLFRPVHDATNGTDGWVSMEISPLLASDTDGSLAAALAIRRKAARTNLYVKIPGTPASIPAVEEAIFAGVPINITLLFSRSQYVAAAEAYLRGIERRLAAGLDPHVASVASVFVSRWDVAANLVLPTELHNRLGIAAARDCYRAYRELLASTRWRHLASAGATPQRLLWASTGVKDPAAPDTMYVSALAAPDTINTVPEATLLAFVAHGTVGEPMAADGGDADSTFALAQAHGVDLDSLAVKLQVDGAEAFVRSWRRLLERIDEKTRSLEAL
jgi:transaldolase